jgi:hypothetical protein
MNTLQKIAQLAKDIYARWFKPTYYFYTDKGLYCKVHDDAFSLCDGEGKI